MSLPSKHHKFLWDETNSAIDSLEKLKAKEYHDRLFKEYAIGDLRNSDASKIALRWRTKKDVICGKGEHICGNQSCDSVENLKSWEVNFRYKEDEKIMNSLVKLRLCGECSVKLNSSRKQKSKFKEIKESKRKQGSCKQQTREKLDEQQGACEDKSSTSSTTLKNEIIESHPWDAKSLQSTANVDGNVDMESYLADLF